MSKVVRLSDSTESAIKLYRDICRYKYPDMACFIDNTSDDDLIRHIIQDFIEFKHDIPVEEQTKSYR